MKKIKKIAFLTVALMLMLSLSSVKTHALTVPSTSWADNTSVVTPSGNTYSVTSGAELAWIAQEVNVGRIGEGATIALARDIDLSAHKWVPIGADNDIAFFKGTFDGGNNTVSNLIIENTTSVQGLFGKIGSTATVKNVKVNGQLGVGYLAGGVVGLNNGGTVDNVSFDGTITATGNKIGGVVGFVSDGGGRVTNSSSSATISGQDNVGGIVGEFAGRDTVFTVNADQVTLTDATNGAYMSGCTFTGSATASGENVGGIAGYNNKGFIENCTATDTVTVTSTNAETGRAGGIVGYLGYNNGQGGEGIVLNCTSSATVKGTLKVGGIVGELRGSAYEESYTLYDKGLTTVEFIYENEGYVIGCTFDGSVTATGDDTGGIAGYSGGVVLTSHANGATVSGVDNVGGAVGMSYGGYVEGCTTSGTVTASGKNAGGVVGYTHERSVVRTTQSSMGVSGDSNVGGIVGKSEGASVTFTLSNSEITYPGLGIDVNRDSYIEGSSFTGSVATTTTTPGSIVGYNESVITNCLSNTSNTYALIGYNIFDVISHIETRINVNVENTYDYTEETDKNTDPQVLLTSLNENNASAVFSWSIDSTKNDGFPIVSGEIIGRVIPKEPKTDAEGAYLIGTPEEFLWFVNGVNDLTPDAIDISNETIKLTDNIDLKTLGNFEPIGEGSYPNGYWESDVNLSFVFGGTFDGAGHKVYNLCMYQHHNEKTGHNATGFFGGTDVGTVIKNLTVEGNILASNYYAVGGIVGSGVGTFDNVHFNGTIENPNSDIYTGGILGRVVNSRILNCTTRGEINGHTNVGGIAGITSFMVYTDKVGAFHDTIINNCHNYATISSSDVGDQTYAGGLFGFVSAASTIDLYNTYIMNSSNSGDVITEGGRIGGIAGQMSLYTLLEPTDVNIPREHEHPITVFNCYNTGKITGTRYVGGIVGHAGKEIGGSITETVEHSSVELISVYNAGKIEMLEAEVYQSGGVYRSQPELAGGLIAVKSISASLTNGLYLEDIFELETYYDIDVQVSPSSTDEDHHNTKTKYVHAFTPAATGGGAVDLRPTYKMSLLDALNEFTDIINSEFTVLSADYPAYYWKEDTENVNGGFPILDVNRDVIIPEPLHGDVNDDGNVDVTDLNEVMSSYNMSSSDDGFK